MEADVELAWGDFTDEVTTLDFTHGQELPMTYVQPLEDDTLKLLIDAGLYRDERFEELMTKLIMDEMFDADADISVTHLDVGVHPTHGETVPILLADPVNVVHDHYDASEHTTIAQLIQRSAKLAIELRKEGVQTEDLMRDANVEKAREVFIEQSFKDVVTQKAEAQIEQDVDNSFKTESALLDREIDVTEQLKGSLSFANSSEDDRIRDLKERERTEPTTPAIPTTNTMEPVASKTALVPEIEGDGAFPTIGSVDFSVKAESSNHRERRQAVDPSHDDGPEL